MFKDTTSVPYRKGQKDNIFINKTKLMSEIQMIKDTITKYTDEDPDNVKISIKKIENIIDGLDVYTTSELGLSIFNIDENRLLVPKMTRVEIDIPVGMDTDVAMMTLGSTIRHVLESKNKDNGDRL